MEYSSTTDLTEKVPTVSGMTSLHSPVQLGNGDLNAPSLIAGISSIPMQLFSEGNKITEKERYFLEAAEKGDKAGVERCLQPPDKVNVNVTNLLGRSALQMAVDNENIEIVELLLAQPGIDIGDALLQAIREGVYRMVEMMVNHPSISRHMLGEGWSSAYRSKRKESSDYSPDISPVILAAHCNQFEILQLLLTRGATINKPHSVVCICANCSEKQKEDILRYSLDRINCFRALASPAWISLTNNDPILAAFKLSWELHMLSIKENEFKDIFTTLEAQTKMYAVELLEQCRTTEEVIAVLNKDSDEDDQFCSDRIEEGQIALTRFRLALKYDQKQFVAHPHAQQLLASIWYEGIPGWRRRHPVTKVVICLGLSCLLPFMAVYYLIFPRSKIGQLMRSPLMKFMNHSASFIFFLLLLVYASTRGVGCEEDKRGRRLSFEEATIMVFAFGMIWAECKQLWEEGLKAYIRQWWNWLDFIMLSLYLTTFSLRFATMYLVHTGRDGYNSLDTRAEWPQDDPTLLAEGIFSIANVFSFARIIFLFQANPYLGPLQISLGCMLIDIFKFLLIFFLVLLSFACGMNKLYSNSAYTSFEKNCRNQTGDNQVCYDNTGEEFTGLSSAIRSLIWALVGLINKDVITERDPSIAIFGEILFLSYQLVAIIVLLNMLIAMMSSSFQNIENHADVEWKFARSKLWISYFDEGSTLPPPLNLVISPKSIYSCYLFLKKMLCSRMIHSRKMSKISRRDSLDGNFKHNDNGQPSTVTPDLRYQDVMKRLVSRYIHLHKAKQKADGVNEDDLNEIKQDISSLRYELREDRKREEARGKFHFDAIKKDIVNALQVKEGRKDKMNFPSNNRLETAHTRRGNAIDTDSVSTGSDSRQSSRILRSSSNRKDVKHLQSIDPTMDYQPTFTEGNFKRNGSPVSPSNVSRMSTEDYVTKRDLDELKKDIVGSLTEEIRKSLSVSLPPVSPSQPNSTPSYHPHVLIERSDSPLPPTPPPKPKNFRPIHSNFDVDIHGIRHRASSPGIRYHLSPGPPIYDTQSDSPDNRQSFTQL